MTEASPPPNSWRTSMTAACSSATTGSPSSTPGSARRHSCSSTCSSTARAERGWSCLRCMKSRRTCSPILKSSSRLTALMTQTPAKFKMHFTGSRKNPEQHVAYFGEDIGMNVHHVTWHMDFPFWWDDAYGFHLDRKGEL